MPREVQNRPGNPRTRMKMDLRHRHVPQRKEAFDRRSSRKATPWIPHLLRLAVYCVRGCEAALLTRPYGVQMIRFRYGTFRK